MQVSVDKFVPNFLLRQLHKNFLVAMEARRRSIENQLPKALLTSKHIQNCRLLLDRPALLSALPFNGTVAELGVDRGEFSEQILEFSRPEKLHLIDNWGSDRYHDTLYHSVIERFSKQLEDETVSIHRCLSTDAAVQFPDGYFDWIYIDTDHSYATTAAELEMYRNKVKLSGFIAGHDFVLGNWVKGIRYGVIEAIHEFCVKYDWEFVYLTCTLSDWNSFAIRRIEAH